MPIRVLLDASTSLVKSALKATLGDCPDIVLIEPLKATAIAESVDVVVVQKPLFGELPPLHDAARIGIVTINDDGQAGELYRIQHNKWKFSPGPYGGLADAIRAVAIVH